MQDWPETGSTKPVRPETAHTTGCVAFPEPAYLIYPPRFAQSERSSSGSEDEQERTRLPRRHRDETSATKATAERMVGVVFSAIGGELAQDEPVAIAGFGTIFTRTRAPRRGRNPRTGESLDIAASTTPAFKASKKLRDTVGGRG